MAKYGHEPISLPGTPFGRGMRIPHVEPGMTVGLFGGSFNPPHEGHLLVTRHALTRAKLDQVWWLVSPGNPLKDTSALKPLVERISLSEGLLSDRRVKVTGIETRFETRYTCDTLQRLCQVRPNINFVWIMGADSLKNFHAWRNWRKISELMPIIVVDRPGSTFAARSSKAAICLTDFRRKNQKAQILARTNTPCWSLLHGPRSSRSSTQIRNEFGFSLDR